MSTGRSCNQVMMRKAVTMFVKSRKDDYDEDNHAMS